MTEKPENNEEQFEAAEAAAEADVAAEEPAAEKPKPKRTRKPPVPAGEAAPGKAETAAEPAEAAAEEPSADEPAEPEAAAPEAAEPEAEEQPKPKRTRAKKADADEPKAEEAETPARKPARKKADDAAKKQPAPRRRKRGERREVPVGVEVRAQARYVRTSARKARLVCDHIRGKDVAEARAILAFTPRAAAKDWAKLLESAVANAEHNHELVGEELRIAAVYADEGPTLKRFRPRAMGRATRIRKRTSHLTITLTPKEL
jgi:ribosomal protein L22